MEDAVDAREVEIVGGKVRPQNVQAAGVLLLQRPVVVVGEAVDADDVVARVDERIREVRADEAGDACDDVAHRGTLAPRQDRGSGCGPESSSVCAVVEDLPLSR